MGCISARVYCFVVPIGVVYRWYATVKRERCTCPGARCDTDNGPPSQRPRARDAHHLSRRYCNRCERLHQLRGAAALRGEVQGTPFFEQTYSRDILGRITSITETLTIAPDPPGHDGEVLQVRRGGPPLARLSGRRLHDDHLRVPLRSNGNRPRRQLQPVRHAHRRRLRRPGPADLHSVLNPRPSVLRYTANGGAGKTDAGGQTTYTYDALGNLRQVLLPDGTLIEYAVDGRNRRIGKRSVNKALSCGSSGSITTNSNRWRSSTGGTPRGGVHLRQQAACTRSDEAERPSYRIVSDHLGSVRLVVDVADNTVAHGLSYDEFGQLSTDSTPGYQVFGFAGGLIDPDSGLLRFAARDYDPAAARWTAKDPIGFDGGTARYGYALQDPVNFIDTDGNNPKSNIGGDDTFYGDDEEIRQLKEELKRLKPGRERSRLLNRLKELTRRHSSKAQHHFVDVCTSKPHLAAPRL